MDKETLLNAAAVVRDENTESANTATRIGELFINTIEQMFSMTGGIRIIAVLQSINELPDTAKQGDCYLINGNVYLYVGQNGDVDGHPEWSFAGTFRGPQGETGPRGADGVSLGEVAIVDDLTSGGRTSVLSAEQGKVLKKNVDELQTEINKTVHRRRIYKYFADDVYTEAGLMRANGTISPSASYIHTEPLPISGVEKFILHTKLASETATSFFPVVVWLDSNDNVISYENCTAGESDYELTPPAVAAKAVFNALNDFVKAGDSNVCHADIVSAIPFSNKIYISTTGDDNNDGLTSATPVLTIRKAASLLDPDGELVMLAGDYYDIPLDISNFGKITGQGNVRYISSYSIISAEPVSGYTRVLSATVSKPPTTGTYLWQHDVADEASLISATEAHPLQEGKTHRLPSTRIYPAASIAEIESSTDVLKWYNSGKTLYFSKTEGTDLSANPIIIPRRKISGTAGGSIEIRNVKFLYAPLKLNGMHGMIENVSAGMMNATGAIIYDGSSDFLMRRCEAFGCSNDGFNGHGTAETPSDIVLEDCWGHDNSDDGESCHEYCTVTSHGGLYEYNGNGCTPASGGKAIYHNVLVRKNGDYSWTTDKYGSGFSCQGSASGNSVMECYNCTAEDNTYGFRNTRSYGNAVVYNCIAENNDVDYSDVIVKETNEIDRLAETLNKIVNVSDSVNLFNKSDLIDGYVIVSTGNVGLYQNSKVSDVIPVIPGHYYLLSGRTAVTGFGGIRCLDINGNPMKVLAANTNTEFSSYNLPNEDCTDFVFNGQFKVPEGAVGVQFTVIFGNSGNIDDIMLEDLGTEYHAMPIPSPYVPFGTKYNIKKEVLPNIEENPLSNKSVIFVGSSICAATTDAGGGWAKRIGEKNNMKYINHGVNGATITDKNIVGSSFTISSVDFGEGADYIILQGGSNDADRIGSIINGEIPEHYGSFSENGYSATFTNDTFCGAVEYLIKKIVSTYPNAKVGFIIAHKMGVSNDYTKENNNRRAYFETIIKICRKWGIPVLNLWDTCTLNPKIASHYTSGEDYLYIDGQHLTSKGYDIISPIIESWMKSL